MFNTLLPGVRPYSSFLTVFQTMKTLFSLFKAKMRIERNVFIFYLTDYPDCFRQKRWPAPTTFQKNTLFHRPVSGETEVITNFELLVTLTRNDKQSECCDCVRHDEEACSSSEFSKLKIKNDERSSVLTTASNWLAIQNLDRLQYRQYRLLMRTCKVVDANCRVL